LSKDNSQGAFPSPHDIQSSGMSLRDYFAGQALVGRTAAQKTSVSGTFEANQIAKECYLLADEMLKLRAK
jgi:hypothetical protein